MKRLTILFALSLCISYIYAEKTEDRYVVRPVQEGLLYFIEPFEVPSKDKMPAAELDITYIVSRDSFTLNMSIRLPEAIDADSIGLGSRTDTIVRDFHTFFIDKEKNRFKHRYSCTLPYTCLHTLYQSPMPYTLTIYAGGRKLQYGYAERAWSKERSWMQQILLLADKNKSAVR